VRPLPTPIGLYDDGLEKRRGRQPMNVKRLLIDSFIKAASKHSEIAEQTARDRRNSDIVLSWALEKFGSSTDILFPVDYVEFLRDCIEKKRLKIQEIKADSSTSRDSSAKRFSSLVDALRHVPPIEFSIAQEIALIADSYRGNPQLIEHDQWAGEVRSHFEISSSSGTKGRILTTVARFTQSRHCLELGTAYGISALFILEALKKRGTDTHLTTLEGLEPQFSMSSKILKNRYSNHVSCEFGWIQEVLPRIVRSLECLDFLFHDAGHNGEEFVRDFHTVLPILTPGALVLFDDIHWEDPRFSQGKPHSYEGWMEVLQHQRVRRAVEIDDMMGLLLVGG
jgi:predicted O-methyltransferase YrrM